MKFAFFTLFISLFLHSPIVAHSNSVSKIHALVVVDTLSKNLDLSTLHDKLMIQGLLLALVDKKTEVATSIIEGEQLSIENIKKWVFSLNIGPQDILFFYYSGHGRQNTDPLSPWPIIQIKDGAQYIRSETIFSELQKRKPRLLVTITDCCNNLLFVKGTTPSKLRLKQDYIIPFQKSHTQTNLSHLFKKKRGFISITASKPGFAAMATKDGGVMTQALLGSISSYNKKKAISWSQLMGTVKKRTKKYNQEPYYKFSLK